MEAAPAEPPLAGHFVARSQTLYTASKVDARVRQELTGQYETAVAFADFCTFLTMGRLSDQARQLVSLAEELLAETSENLQQSKHPR